ncbi:putative deoxyhypusine synthase [Helianthus anomalus]
MSIVIITFHSIQASLLFSILYIQTCDSQVRLPTGFTSNLISSGVRDVSSSTSYGAALRSKGLNRIGNLLVPNDNYCKFEDWIIPIFDQMLIEQNTQHVLWTPSKVIARLGKEINNETSYLYWAYKNDIPVFCPGLTDGSLGDMLYFHSFRNPGLVVDIVQAVSWGKIRASAKSVKVNTQVFSLIDVFL